MKFILSIAFFVFSYTLSANSQAYYFSNLSLENGLSQITVTSIHQDQKGYMWFGTRNGLNKYNGYNFNIFKNEPENTHSISDNHILCIAETKEGDLWIGTNNGLNKLDVNTNKFTRYFHSPGSASSLSHNMVQSLFYDNEGNLWIGTNNGLNLYDKSNNSFIKTDINGLLNNNPINTIARHNDNLYIGTSLQGLIVYNTKTKEYTTYKENVAENIRHVFVDSNENTWIGTYHNGLYLLKKGSKEPVNYNSKTGLTNNNIRCITESPDGNILIGTFNGLNIIDPQNNITQYKTYGLENGNLSHYSIYCIYYDKSQTLWIGTYAGGVNYYSPYGQKFRFYDPNSTLQTIVGIVGPVLQINECLYVATEGGGLLEIDKDYKKIKQYKLSDNTPDSYGSNILKSLYYDDGEIFCGTNLGTVYTFDLKTKKFTLFYDLKQENSIYHISKNKNGDLIIGGVNQVGMTILNKNKKITNSFPVANNKEISFHNVRCIYELKDNVYLIGTRNDGLYYYDLNKKTLERFYHNIAKNMEDRLPVNYITNIFKDSAGNIWVGTFGGGLCLFDINTKTFSVINTKKGIPDNNICSINEDNNRHLWVSTISGIFELNPYTEEIKNYTYSSGIKINEFTPHAGIRLSDGMMVFSGNNGFISFNPRKMSVNPYIPPVGLSNFYVNNEKVTIGDRTGILDKLPDSRNSITLTYAQANNISIEYSALNYIFSDRNQYAYILEGFDEKWNEVGTRRIAYYTNIPPGDYIFKVRGSNNDGVWNYEGASIAIKVLPPFWRTWWAYLIYIALIVAVAYFILKYFYERKKLENEVKLKQAESKAREEFHQARDKLFTNFSHELRTPLTLILSPLEDMVQNEKSLPEIHKNHQLMYSNGLRLLRLVNNLMDFQKRESGNLKLKISEGNFIGFTEEMVSLFEELAYSRNIKLEFCSAEKNMKYWFDKNLMEKVYFNFLSNAFKNTPNNGSVSVKIQIESLVEIKKNFPQKNGVFDPNVNQYIVLTIEDSGIGIESEELEKIFIPFYQVAQNEHSSSGTGLGLSLSKSVIELHHGIVWAESPENTGAVFICILPVSKAIYKDDEVVETLVSEDDNLYAKPDSRDNKLIITSATSPKGSYTIMVVEDNIDVRKYIISHLSGIYKVIDAANGADAIDKAIRELPDLIISDLMMPKMDGMEMTQALKTDLRTSHIPIILLTAKSMPSDIKEGYETGADDYITKPFNASVLVARVNNIIQSREKLKEIYGKRFSLETLGVETVSVDERFMQKLYQVLEKNISNPELKLDGFSKEIGMSKANLYRKIKALTNHSPNEFIRNFRLEMSAKILKESQLPISEVYVAVGFNSHAYFSNCFKSLYGVSPTEYASQALRQDKDRYKS